MAWKYYLALLLLLTSRAQAQQTFVEGRIRYAVSIGPVSDSTGFTEHAGTYTLIVKGMQVRKELSMNNGYQNVLLMNSGQNSVYSLQTNGGRNYAIQLSLDDMKQRQQPYQGFTQQEMPGSMTIAGWPCQKTMITYKDGTRSALYYTTSWNAPDVLLFDRFPGIRQIPLAFEYRNEEGIIMHFQAERLEAVPVENALFRIPPDYKIISNAEYKQRRQ